MIAFLEAVDIRPHLDDLARGFMAEDQRQLHRQRAVRRRKIGMAHAAGRQLDGHLAAARRLDADLLHHHRLSELSADDRARFARHAYLRVLSNARGVYIK